MPKPKEKQVKESKETLEEAIASIKKKFGNGAIMTLTDPGLQKIEVLPTGIPTLDEALMVGGLPRGRMTEIFGQESTGKSTIAMKIIANLQKQGGKAAYVDVEHTLEPVYAEKLGVDLKALLISQPNSGEEALQICESLIKTGKLDAIIVDTVAALTPMREWEKELGDQQIASLARLMSQSLRRLMIVLHGSKTALIFLNQVRMTMALYGDKTTTPGGLALKFYSSVRINLRRLKRLKKGDNYIGFQVEAWIAKNKVAPPFRSAEIEILFV